MRRRLAVWLRRGANRLDPPRSRILHAGTFLSSGTSGSYTGTSGSYTVK